MREQWITLMSEQLLDVTLEYRPCRFCHSQTGTADQESNDKSRVFGYVVDRFDESMGVCPCSRRLAVSCFPESESEAFKVCDVNDDFALVANWHL
jgi:hypothetical protein